MAYPDNESLRAEFAKGISTSDHRLLIDALFSLCPDLYKIVQALEYVDIAGSRGSTRYVKCHNFVAHERNCVVGIENGNPLIHIDGARCTMTTFCEYLTGQIDFAAVVKRLFQR